MIFRVLFWLLIGGICGLAVSFMLCGALVGARILKEQSDLLGVIGGAGFISGLLAGFEIAGQREEIREQKSSWMPHKARRKGGPILPNAKK